MKNIILVRHGIYTREDGRDPSLSTEGIKQIFSLAKTLKELFEIDAIFYSPATRTRETALIIEDITNPKETFSADWLYEHDNSLDDLKRIDDSMNTICLITHSPNMDDIMGFLCIRRDFDSYANKKALNHGLMGKAVILDFEIDRWSDLGKTTGYKLNYTSGQDENLDFNEVRNQLSHLKIKNLNS